MLKRMTIMLAATMTIVAALGFVKFKQIQTAIAQGAMQSIGSGKRCGRSLPLGPPRRAATRLRRVFLFVPALRV